MSTEDCYDDDVPPLEDMSEAINKKLNLNKNAKKISYLEISNEDEVKKKREKQIENLLVDKPEADAKTKPKSTTKKESSDNFCGFKKGFLNNNNKKTGVKKKEKVIEVKSKGTVKDSKVLPEVQQALKQEIPLLQSNDWVTDNLLEKIMTNPKLAKQFTDPQFNEAIQLFQTDPQKVMRMCKSNKELKEFIQEFCALMGDHFTQLADKQDQKNNKPSISKASNKSNTSESDGKSKQANTSTVSAEDEERMKKIISDPEVSKILQTPDIQKLLTVLRADSNSARRILNNADTALRHKIQKLIDVGLLQFTSG